MSERNGHGKHTVLGLIPDDGYTESGLILAVPRMYPELRFHFRPMTVAERVQYAKAADKLKGIDLREAVAEWLRRKLVDWDLQDAKDQPVPITTANILRLKANLFERLFRIISTEESPDADPEARPDEDTHEDAQAILAALREDKPLAEARTEQQAKN